MADAENHSQIRIKAPKHDTEAHLERTRARLARFGVDVRDDKKRGRCLVAAKDFKRGDLVLANAPYGLPVPMGDRCAGCFLNEDDDRVRDKMRCKACDMVWFCSERCMDGAMDGGHAVECAAMRRYFADDPDDAIRENGFVQFSALHRNCGKAHPEEDEPSDDHLPFLVPTAADKADTIARWALDGFPWREYCGDFAAEATAGARRCGLIGFRDGRDDQEGGRRVSHERLLHPTVAGRGPDADGGGDLPVWGVAEPLVRARLRVLVPAGG